MALILLSADLSQTPNKEISTESIQKGGGATSETGKSHGIGPPGSQLRGWSGSFGWTSNQMDCFARTITLFVPMGRIVVFLGERNVIKLFHFGYNHTKNGE